jgi:hypothetical protein
MELGQLETELLREPLDFRIYLPACYAEQSERVYPVLYLIHGQSYNDDQWERLGVDETADRLLKAKELAHHHRYADREWSQPDVDPFGEAVIRSCCRISTKHRPFQNASIGLLRSVVVQAGLSIWLEILKLFGSIGGHSPPVFWFDACVEKLVDDPARAAAHFPGYWGNDRPEIKVGGVV